MAESRSLQKASGSSAIHCPREIADLSASNDECASHSLRHNYSHVINTVPVTHEISVSARFSVPLRELHSPTDLTRSNSWESELVAGVAGFEPAHGGTKNRCLTAWLHPNKEIGNYTRLL